MKFATLLRKIRLSTSDHAEDDFDICSGIFGTTSGYRDWKETVWHVGMKVVV